MNVIVFGDSIAYGLYDPCGGWIKRYFESMCYFEIINLSRPGATSKQVLEKVKGAIKSGVLQKEKAKIIFAYGINDSAISLSGKNGIIPIELFESNTKKIINLINDFKVDMTFVGITIVNETKTSSFNGKLLYTNKRIQLYNNVLRKICNEIRIEFFDINTACNVEKVRYLELLDDGLHPNENGHEFIFEKFVLLNNK